MKEEVFDYYINAYKMLNITEKRDQLVEQMEDVVALLEKMCVDINEYHNLMLNDELLKLKQSNLSEDEFLTISFILLNIIKESLGSYTLKISDILYE